MPASTAEARRHDRGGAHCRLGKIYRPSLGICESRAAFRRSMRAVAAEAGPTRRELRRIARQERRQLRALRQAARQRPSEPVGRLLPTRPLPRPDEARVNDGPATTAALPSDEGVTGACTVAPQPGFSGIPWTDRGPFSLNPLPRYVAQVQLDWRR